MPDIEELRALAWGLFLEARAQYMVLAYECDIQPNNILKSVNLVNVGHMLNIVEALRPKYTGKPIRGQRGVI